MHIRDDFSQFVAVTDGWSDWTPSPAAGVDRVMLDRIGDEVARATSFVRFAPNARFPAHEHGLGEEFLVLEGTFIDEDGRYPAGSYVRNPAGTSHGPWTEDDGCVIFVKLRQFDPEDQHQFSKDLLSLPMPDAGGSITNLHQYGAETIQFLAGRSGWQPDLGPLPGGLELLVLAGSITVNGTGYGKHAWLRMPPGSQANLVLNEDSQLWIKTGHLQTA